MKGIEMREEPMTVEELIEVLEEFNPEAEVRIASQPNWPMEYDLADVEATGDVVYVAEGGQLGYLPHEAAVAVGWSEPSEFAERD